MDLKLRKNGFGLIHRPPTTAQTSGKRSAAWILPLPAVAVVALNSRDPSPAQSAALGITDKTFFFVVLFCRNVSDNAWSINAFLKLKTARLRVRCQFADFVPVWA